MRNFIKLFLCALLIFTGCNGGGGGGGGTDYIEISTVEDLNKVRDDLDGSYMLMNDISLSDYSSGDGWLPIGDVTAPFTGTFDGNGFAIKELYIDRYTDESIDAGLFGVLDGGTIRNLDVEKCYIAGDSGAYA